MKFLYNTTKEANTLRRKLQFDKESDLK